MLRITPVGMTVNPSLSPAAKGMPPVTRRYDTGGMAYYFAIRPGQETEDRGQRTEDRGQRTEDRGQRTEDRRQMTDDRGGAFRLIHGG